MPSSDDAREQLLDAQLLRSDALDRRDRALQHVVATAELAGALDRDDVARLFDDAHDMRVAPFVAAERAELAFGDVEATPAPRDAVLGVLDRAREPLASSASTLQQIERDALRRLRADTGQAGRARRSASGRALRRALIRRVPSQASRRGRRASRRDRVRRLRAPSFWACSSCAWRIASTTAATTRSSSVSMSSGSTTLGSIVISRSSPSPVTVALHDAAADGRFDRRVRERVLRGLPSRPASSALAGRCSCGFVTGQLPVSCACARRRSRRRGRRRRAG